MFEDIWDDEDRAYERFVDDCFMAGLNWRDPTSRMLLIDWEFYNSEFQDMIEEGEEVEF